MPRRSTARCCRRIPDSDKLDAKLSDDAGGLCHQRLSGARLPQPDRLPLRPGEGAEPAAELGRVHRLARRQSRTVRLQRSVEGRLRPGLRAGGDRQHPRRRGERYAGDTEVDEAKIADWPKVWDWFNANEDKFTITASNNDFDRPREPGRGDDGRGLGRRHRGVARQGHAVQARQALHPGARHARRRRQPRHSGQRAAQGGGDAVRRLSGRGRRAEAAERHDRQLSRAHRHLRRERADPRGAAPAERHAPGCPASTRGCFIQQFVSEVLQK